MPPGSTRQDRPSGEIEISLVNNQSRHVVNEVALCEAARAVLEDLHWSSAAISIAVIDDAAIHELNRRYLEHDWPTDVLSFVLEDQGGHLEGEIVISADTAARAAAEAEWSASAEQVLYVIHGTLHLIGYGDRSPDEAAAMRAAEAKYLLKFGYEATQPIDGGSEAGTLSTQQTRGGATIR